MRYSLLFISIIIIRERDSNVAQYFLLHCLLDVTGKYKLFAYALGFSFAENLNISIAQCNDIFKNKFADRNSIVYLSILKKNS